MGLHDVLDGGCLGGAAGAVSLQVEQDRAVFIDADQLEVAAVGDQAGPEHVPRRAHAFWRRRQGRLFVDLVSRFS